MAFNCKLCEFLTVVGTVDPQVVDDSPVLYTDGINMANWEEVIFFCLVGAIDKKVDFVVYEDTDGAGTSQQALKSATQLTATDDNKQVVINVRRHDLSTGFTYIRGSVVSESSQAAPVSIVAIGANSGPKPTTMADLTTVAQIMT